VVAATYAATRVDSKLAIKMLQGISNEVEPYFGVNKFQLGRLLRARLQQRLRSNAGAATLQCTFTACCDAAC
jgi:hypothetical protein